MYSTLADGEYCGQITSIHFSNDMRFCWINIIVDGKKNGVFNTMFSTIDSVFNNFTCQFVDDEGYFCPEKVIDIKIKFTVDTRVYNNNSSSKISQIKLIEGDEIIQQ